MLMSKNGGDSLLLDLPQRFDHGRCSGMPARKQKKNASSTSPFHAQVLPSSSSLTIAGARPSRRVSDCNQGADPTDPNGSFPERDPRQGARCGQFSNDRLLAGSREAFVKCGLMIGAIHVTPRISGSQCLGYRVQ